MFAFLRINCRPFAHRLTKFELNLLLSSQSNGPSRQRKIYIAAFENKLI